MRGFFILKQMNGLKTVDNSSMLAQFGHKFIYEISINLNQYSCG